jgi:uncharacterized protein
MRSLKRNLLIVCGTVSVGFGLVGIFVPVLPTTPFLLLAAYCYGRSSSKFYDWLLSNRWFGEYIRNYREGRGIPLKQKIFSITMLWLTIGYAVWFVIPLWWAQVIMLGIATGVTVHLLRVKTWRPGDIEKTAEIVKTHTVAEGCE